MPATTRSEKFVTDFVAAWSKVMNLDRFDLAFGDHLVGAPLHRREPPVEVLRRCPVRRCLATVEQPRRGEKRGPGAHARNVRPLGRMQSQPRIQLAIRDELRIQVQAGRRDEYQVGRA
jgi:hypothetical protein